VDELPILLAILAQENWHIHTTVSRCAKPEMTVERILKAAERAKLKRIALVDHHHRREHDILADIRRLMREADRKGTCVDVLFGAELSAYGPGSYSDSDETNREIGYRLYACNHYHIDGWKHPGMCSPRAYAEHALAILRELLPSGRADAIAHPFAGMYLRHKLGDTTNLTRAIRDSELGDILELGRNHGVAFELNPKAIKHDPTFAKRFWDIGLEIGAEFRYGTDAHLLAEVDPKASVRTVASILATGKA